MHTFDFYENLSRLRFDIADDLGEATFCLPRFSGSETVFAQAKQLFDAVNEERVAKGLRPALSFFAKFDSAVVDGALWHNFYVLELAL